MEAWWQATEGQALNPTPLPAGPSVPRGACSSLKGCAIPCALNGNSISTARQRYFPLSRSHATLMKELVRCSSSRKGLRVEAWRGWGEAVPAFPRGPAGPTAGGGAGALPAETAAACDCCRRARWPSRHRERPANHRRRRPARPERVLKRGPVWGGRRWRRGLPDGERPGPARPALLLRGGRSSAWGACLLPASCSAWSLFGFPPPAAAWPGNGGACCGASHNG